MGFFNNLIVAEPDKNTFNVGNGHTPRMTEPALKRSLSLPLTS